MDVVSLLVEAEHQEGVMTEHEVGNFEGPARPEGVRDRIDLDRRGIFPHLARHGSRGYTKCR